MRARKKNPEEQVKDNARYKVSLTVGVSFGQLTCIDDDNDGR